MIIYFCSFFDSVCVYTDFYHSIIKFFIPPLTTFSILQGGSFNAEFFATRNSLNFALRRSNVPLRLVTSGYILNNTLNIWYMVYIYIYICEQAK